jgi:hypothetical protein
MSIIPEKLKNSITKTTDWLASVCFRLNKSHKLDDIISSHYDLRNLIECANMFCGTSFWRRRLIVLDSLGIDLSNCLLDASFPLSPGKCVEDDTIFIRIGDQCKIYLMDKLFIEEYVENNCDNLIKEFVKQTAIALELISKKYYYIDKEDILNSSKLYVMFHDGKLHISNLEKCIIEFLTANNNIHFLRKESRDERNFAYDSRTLDSGFLHVWMEHAFYYLVNSNNIPDFKCIIRLQMSSDLYYYQHRSFLYYFLIEREAIENTPDFYIIKQHVSEFVNKQILDKLAKYDRQLSC